MAVACPERRILTKRPTAGYMQGPRKQLVLRDGKMNGRDIHETVNIYCAHVDVISYPSALVDLIR